VRRETIHFLGFSDGIGFGFRPFGPQSDFDSEDRREVRLACGVGEADRSIEPVVVGDSQCPVSKVYRCLH
jgi:hypothetical protein